MLTANPPEHTRLRRVLTGAVRQGALDSVVLDAIAEAAIAELSRLGATIVPSGPLVTRFAAGWSAEEAADHRAADRRARHDAQRLAVRAINRASG